MNNLMPTVCRRSAVGVFALASCGTNGICDRPATQEPIKYCNGTVTNGHYSSMTVDGRLLYWPAGAHYRMYHGLGAVPGLPVVYLGFGATLDLDGTESRRSLAPAAGNQFELLDRTDDYLEILNGTCADFYIVVEANVDETSSSWAGPLTGCNMPPITSENERTRAD